MVGGVLGAVGVVDGELDGRDEELDGDEVGVGARVDPLASPTTTSEAKVGSDVVPARAITVPTMTAFSATTPATVRITGKFRMGPFSKTGRGPA